MEAAATAREVPKQGEVLRRVLFATVVIGLAHTLLCFIVLQLDFYRSNGLSFTQLFAMIWAGHLALVLFVLCGFNRRLRDPGMTLVLMTWLTLVLLVSAWYVDHVRLSVMVLFFAVLQLGVFRVSFLQMAVLGGICVAGYVAIVLLVRALHPAAIELTPALIQWAAFTVMTLGMVLVAAEISTIRGQLAERNQQLGGIVERIQEMAIKDELTGLFNRRHAMERLGKLREMANRGAFGLIVGYVDLDFFKRVNDRYGHSVGDEVLRAFAATAGEHLSGRDFCARFGGEEFLLVLVKSDLNAARELAENLRHSIEALQFASVPGMTVTVSMGLAEYREGESLDSLLARADEGLYAAKEGGRNRVCIMEEMNA